MKKNYILTLILTLLISGFSFGQGPMITIISDGDCSGGNPKMVEIYAQGAVDFTLYSLEKQSNGADSWGTTTSLQSFGTVTDDFIYIYSDSSSEEVFSTEYPSASPAVESGVVNINGDDGIRIILDSDGSVVDQYGVDAEDGSGKPWEYTDGYAKRIDGTGPDGGFTASDWTYEKSGLNGNGSCQDGTIFEDVMGGVGVYTAPVVYDLLEDFETALPAGALAGDSGMATTPEVVADPATGGTNGDVLKIVTSAGGNGWQNAQLFFQGDLLDLTTDDKVVTVDVYSESAFMMLAKTATPSNGGAESATDASHTGSGWETLTFDFSDPKDNTPVANDIFGRILFFPQWNGAGWNDSSVTTTYVDNIKGTGYTPPVVYDLIEDFETALPAGALAGDSGMATPEVVADPATGGTNGDVLKIVTSAGGNGWQNAQLFFQGDLLDLTTDDKVVTVDVYSESAFMMLAKTATPSNGGAESATDASHTGSGWETLTFDFSDPKDNTPVANDIFGRILFFPQWNGAGWNDSSVTTTYVDNIKGIGYESTPPTGDNSVTIATSQAWNGYVNVFSVSDDSYQFGFGDIEVADIRATATETSVTLEPNISIWTNESTNAAYFDQSAATQTPVVYIEASTYIENSSLANNALTFSGNISTSDLGDGYTVIAFIKSLTSDYSQVAFKNVDISSTGDFTVTATAEEMSQAVIQYGFAVTGPLADPSDTTLGSVVIGAETLGIEDTDIVNVSVYPNPSNSNWNFRTPNTVITSVEVFNLLGKRVVLRKNNSTDIAISTQGLTSGIYIARITTEQGVKSVKLIRE
ncbi:T9SS type A sorting domain-containing protein [Flavobacteriaceae bacterium]|nr:T9SS type A sorting domain-containing protein [Flavobacteriaceae bacterium]